MLNLPLIKKSFNKAAASYDTACQLQLQTGCHLIDLIKSLKSNHDLILDAGCGTGIVTQELVNQFDFNLLYAIDIADNLLSLAKEKMPKENIIIEHANFDNLSHLNLFFDMIFANLALHWSLDFTKTLNYLKGKLSRNGILCFSTPLAGTFSELNDYCSIQHFYEKKDIHQLIETAGFNILIHQYQSYTFNFKNFIAALKSIKAVGTNHVPNRNSQTFRKIRENYSNKNSFELTYHIGYFICQ